MSSQTTIAAISTPPGQGGIGIVRLSGAQAQEIAGRVFRSHSGKPLTQVGGYRASYGRVFDQEGEMDEAVAFCYRAPKSYTGEDVVELCCHGSGYLLNRLLTALLNAGATLAEAGEFTKRAFYNGKFTLTQAEAVADLIGSHSQASARAALAARDGALFVELEKVKGKLLSVSGQLAAWVDYPEEEIEGLEEEQLNAHLTECISRLQTLIAGHRYTHMVKNGVDTAIVGRPNVGKSTLMNLLCGWERSIVTDIAGTTRDVVEQEVLVGSVLLRISDTAGIHATDDPVESIGVNRAQQRFERAQLILAVFDGHRPLDEDDLKILEQLDGRPSIAILNKADLPQQVDLQTLSGKANATVALSAQTGEGIEELSKAITDLLSLDQFDPTAPQLANQRQLELARQACEALTLAQKTLQEAYTLDAVMVCIDEALGHLLSLTGESVSAAVVDEVFSHFCVGK